MQRPEKIGISIVSQQPPKTMLPDKSSLKRLIALLLMVIIPIKLLNELPVMPLVVLRAALSVLKTSCENESMSIRNAFIQ
jgi:hypothetical protein